MRDPRPEGRTGTSAPRGLRVVLLVFLPFMSAYLLSEPFRNVNGVVGRLLKAELAHRAPWKCSITLSWPSKRHGQPACQDTDKARNLERPCR